MGKNSINSLSLKAAITKIRALPRALMVYNRVLWVFIDSNLNNLDHFEQIPRRSANHTSLIALYP